MPPSCLRFSSCPSKALSHNEAAKEILCIFNLRSTEQVYSSPTDIVINQHSNTMVNCNEISSIQMLLPDEFKEFWELLTMADSVSNERR